MKTIIISDDPTQVNKLDNECELLIVTGNLSNFVIKRAIDKYKPKHILGVKGNKDCYNPFPSPMIDIHMNVIEIKGITFGGICGCWNYKSTTAYTFSQEMVMNMMDTLPKVDVLISHNSPYNIHQLNDQNDQGFKGINQYIEEKSPKLIIHGHQEINCISSIKNTRILGVYGEKLLDIKK